MIAELIRVPPEKFAPSKMPDKELVRDLQILAAWGSAGTPELKRKARLYALKLIPEIVRRGSITFHFDSWREGSLNFIREIFKKLFTSGVYLVPPHGEYIYRGRKEIIVKSKPDDKLWQTFSILVSGNKAYGWIRTHKPQKINLADFQKLADKHLITEAERREWWPGKTSFYAYEIRDFLPLPEPQRVEVARGIQTRIKKVNLEEDEPEPEVVDIAFLGKEHANHAYKPFGIQMGSHYHYRFLKRTLHETKWDLYVEPYAGGAAIHWALRRDLGPGFKAVLSDIDPDIVFLNRFLKTATDAEFKDLRRRYWLPSYKHYQKLIDWKPRSRVDRAYRLMYLNAYTFGYVMWGGVRPSFYIQGDRSPSEYRDTRKRIMAARHRLERLEYYREMLQNTIILNWDAFQVIRRYDRKGTFFYIDPPYAERGTKQTSDRKDVETFKQRAPTLAKMLKRLKGYFILEVEPTEFYKKVFKGLPLRTVTTRAPFAYQKQRKLLFASNVPLKLAAEEFEDDEPEFDIDDIPRLTNFELLMAHGWLHLEAEGLNQIPESLVALHFLIVSEMKRRNMEHRYETALDEATEEYVRWLRSKSESQSLALAGL